MLTGYGKTVSHVIIGLKTAKGTKQLKLDPSIYESLQKEKVETGDVIYIEANSGAVKRQGRSDTFATEFDLEVSVTIVVACSMASVLNVFLMIQEFYISFLDFIAETNVFQICCCCC